MNEWKRILSDRRRRIVLICIPILCLVLFIYQKCDGNFANLQSDAKEYQELLESFEGKPLEDIMATYQGRYDLTKDEARLLEQAEHLHSYESYLQQIQKNAQKMQMSSLFGADKNSFTYRNIIKTAQDFEGLTVDNIALCNDRGLQDWLAFSWADWFFLGAMLLLVMSFFDDRHKGLAAIIRSCPAGRSNLQLSRLGVLLGHSAMMVTLLYFLPLIVSFCIDGGIPELTRSVQSLAEFRKCTENMSILSFLIRFFLVKTACGFLLGILFWFCLNFLEQIQLCWAATAAVLAVEYLLYTMIPVHSIFSPLREINVFSYAFTFDFYTRYDNINFIGYPAQRSSFLLVLLMVAVAVLSLAILMLTTRRYPFGNRDVLGKLLHLWNRIADAVRRRLGLYGLEWYKLLFLTAGGLFLLFSLLLTDDPRYNSGAYYDVDDSAYRQYIAQIQGPVTQETYDYIQQARAALEKNDLNYTGFASALDRLENTLAEMEAGAWLVDDVPFMNIYGEKANFLQQKNGLITLICLVTCLSPLFSCEESGDVRKVLKATAGGRQRFFWNKYLLALGLTFIVWLLTTGREWQTVTKSLGNVLLSAPCSSIESLRDYPMTVGWFLMLVYLSRLLVLLAPMHLCIFISERSGGFEKAFLISGLLLVIPAAVVLLGADAVAWITPMTLLSYGNFLFSGISGIILFAVWTVLSIVALLLSKHHWCRT